MLSSSNANALNFRHEEECENKKICSLHKMITLYMAEPQNVGECR